MIIPLLCPWDEWITIERPIIIIIIIIKIIIIITIIIKITHAK